MYVFSFILDSNVFMLWRAMSSMDGWLAGWMTECIQLVNG